MKKLFAVLIAVMVVFSGLVADAYNDVDSTTKYKEAIDFLTYREIVSGYPDGTFKPSQTLNRAELLRIVIGSVYADTSLFTPFSSNYCFTDIDANQWYTQYVCFAYSKGFIDGYPDGSFRPDDKINLVEALKISLEVFGVKYEATDPWYKGLVERASVYNYIPLDFISFDQEVTRGQMADLVTRMRKSLMPENEDTFISELDAYLKYLAGYKVTYESLKNHEYVGPITASDGVIEEEESSDDVADEEPVVDPIEDPEFQQYENFDDPSGYKVSLVSEDVELINDLSCSSGYTSGNFYLYLMNSLDEVVDLVSVGDISVPEDALYSYKMYTNPGKTAYKSFIVLRKYHSCDGEMFAIYDGGDDYSELREVKMLDWDTNEFFANGVNDISFGVSKITYKYYDNTTGETVTMTLFWDDEQQGFYEPVVM